MKIIEVIPQLSSGGAERFVVDLCNQLAGRGHSIVLVVLHSLSNNSFFLKEVNPDVRVVSMNKRMGADLSLPFRLSKFIRKEKPDVVHTHLRGIVYDFFDALTSGQSVMHCHTVHTAARQEAGGGISAFVRRYSFSHHLSVPVTISEESERSFEDYYGFKAHMIPNGRNIPADLAVSDSVASETAGYHRSPQTRILVCLARIMSVKRQTMLARIAKRLEGNYDFQILLIGKFLDTEMVSEIRSLDCPSVHLLGERSNPLEYLKVADAFCLCSSYEGAPISLIEALATGCVPVCTPVGSIVDIIKDGVNGLLAADLSEEAYQAALERFLNMTSDQISTLSAHAVASSEPFSMTACAERYERLFTKD